MHLDNELNRFASEMKEKTEGYNFDLFEACVEAYVEALYFTDGSADMDDDFGPDNELSLEASVSTVLECWAAWVILSPLVEDLSFDEAAQIGHDLWLTRNGHGAGFWDGDWPEPFATKACEVSKVLGEVWPYKGDDGLVYIG